MTAKEVSISELLGLDSPRGGFGLQDSYSGLSTPPPANDAVFQQNRGDRKGASSAWNYASVVANGRFKRNLSDGSGSAASSPTSSISSMYSTNSDSCGSSPLGTYQPWSTARAHSNSSPESEDSSAAFNTDRNIGDLLGGLTLQDAATVRGARGTEVDIFTIQQNLQTLQALRFLQQSSSPLGVSVSPTGWSYQNRYNPLLDQWTAQPSAFNSLPENVVVQLDRAAHFHRSAAAVSYANCTWNGVLPPRRSKATGYSSKVFLGGVPWDISEQTLMQTFKQFGPIHVEWPGKDKQSPQPKGYVYIIFESERHVRALLQCCTGNPSTGNFYYKISSKRMKSKQVQVIPWPINDSNCTKSTTQKLDPSRTVFVGALHGVLNAEGLSKIMNDLFDGVVYTGIDTDKYKYPIGSGRVTFNNERSYFKAVSAAFIEVQTEKFTKTIQVDPYLEDSLCSHCAVQQGPYFCRDLMCFRYFCRSCWQFRHQKVHHKPMTRNSKNSGVLNLSG